jgi:hypothetical protein
MLEELRSVSESNFEVRNPSFQEHGDFGPYTGYRTQLLNSIVVPVRMGRASKKGKKKPGQHTRNPRGGKPGRPCKAEVAERERKKKQAERMQHSRENRKRQREELGAGPSGPEPVPDMSVLGAKSTANKKVK